MEEDFCSYIGLADKWPSTQPNAGELDHSGHLAWAISYFEAAECLHFAKDAQKRFGYFAGPLMQITGLATELALKCMMRGNGATETQIRNVGHCTYKAYLAARDAFDEVKFVTAVMSNSEHLPVPKEVKQRLAASGEDPEVKWRVYFDHLRVLDTVYDRPYRNRYMTPGSVVLPEPEIILIGTKLIIAAMKQRLSG